MGNLFDADSAPLVVPATIVVGDFVQWKRSDLASDYAVASHSAELVARLSGGGASEIRISSTEGADYYLFTAESSATASYTAGDYHWQLEMTETSSGNRLVVERGTFKVLADLDNSDASHRSHAETMVSKIETILEGKADADVASYSIAGRSISKMTFEELTQARDMYRREVTQEKIRERARQGKATGSTIKVRF